ECLIIGYTEGKGSRESLFGALQIAVQNGTGLEYRGKVGTGFDTKLMKSVYSELQKIKKTERPVKEKPIDDAKTIWLEPKLFCEVEYASMTPNATFREPVFVRLRPDLVREE
ncbi:MAG: ATP-dependent DNA ligase, partial [bacterium]